MSTDWLVVGLGNPGVAYVGSRHNAGADVVFLLAARHGGHLTFAKRERSMVDIIRIGGTPSDAGSGTSPTANTATTPTAATTATADPTTASPEPVSSRVALAFPQTYMNESGLAVGLLMKRYEIDDPSRLVVVHDELDLPHARIRVKEGGGLAGHNGLRSIRDHLHTDAFLRVRIGIGKPPGGKEQGADHVLKRPSKAQKTELEIAVQEAADAVELILAAGVQRAMNRYNASPPP